MKRFIVSVAALTLGSASMLFATPPSYAQNSSLFAPPTPGAQRENARGYMLNDSVSGQTACERAVIPTRGNSYSLAECEQDMASASAEIDSSRRQREASAEASAQDAYAQALKRAVEASLASGQTDFACSQALRSANGISDVERDTLEDRCNKDMRPMYVERVRAASYKSQNCEQWTIKKGDAWRNARPGMQYRPLATSAGPVSFSGDVKNADDSRLTVIDDGHPAYVDVDSSTMIFNPDKVQVGGIASGYGAVSGKANVELTTGAAMTIPVIKAACIE